MPNLDEYYNFDNIPLGIASPPTFNAKLKTIALFILGISPKSPTRNGSPACSHHAPIATADNPMPRLALAAP